MTDEDRTAEVLPPAGPSLCSESPGAFPPRRRARDRLFWGIVGAAGLLGTGWLALYVAWGAGPVLAELPWFNALSYVSLLLAAATVAFLAWGRYQVLREPVGYWIGLGFAGYSILVVFYILTWPGLVPPRILTPRTESSAWLLMLAWSLLAACLLAAAGSGRDRAGELSAPDGRGPHALVPWLSTVTLIAVLAVVGDPWLPALVMSTGGWTAPAWIWQALLTLAYAVGVVRSIRRYRRSGDTLPGYVALSQLVLAFGIGGMLLGGKRYDLWWYLARVLGVGGFLAMMGGLLAEYVTLFRREQAKTREVEAQAAALRRVEAALRQLNEDLEGRVQDRTAALQEREEWLRVTLASIGDAVLATDTTGRITLLNPVAEGLTGWSQAEAAGQPAHTVFRIIDQRTRGPAEDLISRVLAEGAPMQLANHTALLARDGRRIPIEDSASPIRSTQGQIVGVVVVFHDVTEKRQAQEALRSLACFPDENPYPVLRVTRDGALLYANRTSGPLLRTWDCQVGQRLPEDWCRRVAETCVRGTLTEVEVTCAEGRVYSCILTPIATAEYLNLYARDITARKQAEEDLRRLNAALEQRVQARTAKLAQQTSQLQTLAGELTIAEQRERQRLAEVLHDGLQQLLVAAKLRLTFLPRADPGGFADGCREVADLLEEAIASSRQLTGELSPPVLQTGGLVAGLEWLVRWKAEKYRLAVTLDADPQAVPDSEAMTLLLFQSVRELLFNVVKHAQVRAARVEVRQQDGHLQIVVSDQGVGFDPATLPTARSGGLGLASIRQRLEYLGGCVGIASASGQGCRVTLAAPLQSRASVPSPSVIPKAGQASRDLGREAKIRILLVDDHAVVRHALAQMLGAEPDLEVVGEAADGKIGVELTKQLHPDVVLMDLNMPVLNGLGATQQLQADCPGVQVIGLSMFGAAEQAAAMRSAGAVAYVSKSAPAEELFAAIRVAVRRSS